MQASPLDLTSLGLIPALAIAVVALWRKLESKDQQLLDCYAALGRQVEVSEATADAIERMRTEMRSLLTAAGSTPR